jgi:hypothetical protein
MNTPDKIKRLREFDAAVREWERSHSTQARTYINENLNWVHREVLEAGCLRTLTISPPPAFGGMVMHNVDPFRSIFTPAYGDPLTPYVFDMLDQTIGVLRDPPPQRDLNSSKISVEAGIQQGYAFVAMPIDPSSPELEDVLDAIKEAALRCGITAERVDEPHSNERITDRILESIKKAEFVIVDLTGSRPNVFYEAGYAQGLQKTPIYIAKEGTKLEFDLKDYPIIFYRSLKALKDALEARLRGLRAPKAA